MSETFVVKARGLPWSATAAEVVKFFSDVPIINGEEGVHFTYNKEGRPSGECFVEVATEADRDLGLAHNNEHMGKRYIEIKEAKHSEMEWVVNRMSSGNASRNYSENIVRLRGLPFGCSRQDIDAFFQGLQIIPYGITITVDQDGRASGDAYVEFATAEDAESAMGKHKEKIGHRYIEVFRSSRNDIKHVVGQSRDNYGRPPFINQRPGPYDRPNFGGPRRGRGGMNLGPSGFNSGNYDGGYDSGRSGRGGRGGPMRGGRSGGMGGGMTRGISVQNSKTGHSIHMRGLPFEATTNDVSQFFAPLNPVDIRFIFDQMSGRVKGECDVDFATHNDAEAAMKKDKQNMGHRYIELFLNSTATGNPVGGGGNNMGGGWSNNNNMGNMSRGDGGVPPLMGGGGRSTSSGMGGGMGAGSYGGSYDNQQSGGQAPNSGYGGTSQQSNMGGGYGTQNTGSSYGATPTQNTGGYGNNTGGSYSTGYGQAANNSGGSYGGGYDNKNVSYPSVQQQQGGAGNYYGNMR